MRTMKTPPLCARDSSRAYPKAASASRRTWRGRSFSSPPRLRISIPATFFMLTAATPPGSCMPRHGLRRGKSEFESCTMSKAKIAVVGAGLMGHAITQVFALAGHEVTVSDTVMKNLDTLATRITANLRDLGEDESAVARVRPCVDLGEAVRGVDYVVEAV